VAMFAGLDVGGKTTAICIVDEAGKIVWQGMVDTHPDMISLRLRSFQEQLVEVGVETGSFTPHLYRALAAMGLPMVCMDARRAADAIKSRRIKSDKADAFALAEMLRTGWFAPVHVKSADSHRIKSLLGARDQFVKVKRSLGNQVRGLLRPFGLKLPSRVGTKLFLQAAHQAVQKDRLLSSSISALLEALASIDAQIAKLDDEVKDFARRSEVAWRLMSVPSIGPVTALAFIAAIEDPKRFGKAGADRKNERATRWLQRNLRFIHCAIRTVSACVGPLC